MTAPNQRLSRGLAVDDGNGVWRFVDEVHPRAAKQAVRGKAHEVSLCGVVKLQETLRCGFNDGLRVFQSRLKRGPQGGRDPVAKRRLGIVVKFIDCAGSP